MNISNIKSVYFDTISNEFYNPLHAHRNLISIIYANIRNMRDNFN